MRIQSQYTAETPLRPIQVIGFQLDFPVVKQLLRVRCLSRWLEWTSTLRWGAAYQREPKHAQEP
ncbi:MAG: hypothetical protein ACRD72_25970 [Candidatus Angelobacter sp.]